MTTMITVQPVPHHVALAGIVVDAETSQRLAGVTATITSMPAAFQKLLAGKAVQHGALWATMTERPDRTSTGSDGSFAFADLPDGAYVVTFSAPPSVGLYGSPAVPFAVAARAEVAGAPVLPVVPMPPTGVRGVVNGRPAGGGAVVAPLLGARIRVRGSGEVAHARRDGRFYLPNVGPGALTLEFTLANYASGTRPVVVARGAITDLGAVTLTPSSHC
jgi:hypothetical protein